MTTTKERRAEILALHREGLDDVAIACRLLCDVRVVMRVLAEAGATAAEGGGDQALVAAAASASGPPAEDPARPQIINWGRGRMIRASADGQA